MPKGRKKKNNNNDNNTIFDNINNTSHSKASDDNIMKKINSNLYENIRNWLNNSFIDENGNFESQKLRKKLKKKLFCKLSPKIITINLKKSAMLDYLKKPIKGIYYNNLSKKYTKRNVDENKLLIDEVYKEQKQKFVIFILELKLNEIFDYFNGQTDDNYFRNKLHEQNLGSEQISIFLNNFEKADKFLKKMKEQQEKIEKNHENIKDYIQRVTLLCLNYQIWFQKKFSRKTVPSKNSKA